MFKKVLLTVVFTLSVFIKNGETVECNGCLQLDEYNFEKVLKRFKASLIKFDVAYPYGDKHDTFSQLATELASHKDINFGLVGIKDYGEKENEKLAERYGIRKEDLPVVGLFLGNTETPIPFPQDTEWTIDNLRTFLRDNSKLYIGLPGCLETFDKLSAGFVSGKQWEIIKKAEELSKKLTENDEKASAEIYIKYMKKIMENGPKFITNEQNRITKILKESKLAEKKKQDLSKRLNILKAFELPKDEL